MAQYFGVDPGASPSDATILAALYARFNNVASLWKIKAGTALVGGSDGFVIEPRSGAGFPAIAFRRGGGTAGGTMCAGGAVASGGVFIGVDPAGALDDVSSATGTFDDARWSGWIGSFVDGTALYRGRIKIKEEADRILIRQRYTGTADYSFVALAGKILDPGTSHATGYGVIGRATANLGYYASNPADLSTYEASSGKWAPFILQGAVATGLALPHSQDGSGNFRYAKAGILAWKDSSTYSSGFVVGLAKDLFFSVVQTEGTYWRNPPDHPTDPNEIRAVHILDALLVPDDGTVLE